MSAGLALPMGGSYFGVHTLSQPQFLLSNIEITGTACLEQDVVKKEIEAELSGRKALFFTRGNTFLFNANALSDRLTTNLPINSVEISTDGNTLRVAIVEDVVMVLIHSADNWLLADLNGAVLRQLSADEIVSIDSPTPDAALPFDKIPKILLNEGVSVESKEPIYPAERLAMLAELDKGLRGIGLTPHRYTLDKRKDTWLSVSTKEKPYAIYVELEKPVDAQMKILASVFTQHEEIPGMSYIDLRFGNRVYMK